MEWYVGSLDYWIVMGICTAIAGIGIYIASCFYSSVSTQLKDTMSFILSNEEIKIWLKSSRFPEESYTYALKAMMKIVDEGMDYKYLTKDEKNSILKLDYFLRSITAVPEHKLPIDMKFMQILEFLVKENSDRPDSAFDRMAVTFNTSLLCPSTTKTMESTEKCIFLKTDLSRSDLDKNGAFSFRAKQLTEYPFCTQCNAYFHKENKTLTFASANKYFIWKIVATEDFKGTTVQFKEQYYLKNEAGEILQPNKYEIVSILYIRLNWFSVTMHFVENKGQPLVFNDLAKNGAYFVMMKEKSDYKSGF
ncbi:hypothetical protein ENBRE01_1531 [Enteropsectra breve]|nr:hypothetical protein ENBRE01_1531 [Enteropsectra breve]